MRGLETAVAQVVQSALGESIDVRVGEQLATIPQDKVVVVNLDSKKPKNATFSDVFENTFKIQLQMHYADNTEESMENAGKAIHLELIKTDTWANNNDVLFHQVIDSKKSINENSWQQEFSYLVLSVDKES